MQNSQQRGASPREKASLGQVNTTVTLSHKYIYTSLHINVHTLKLSPCHMHMHKENHSQTHCHTCVHQALIEYLIYSLTNINMVRMAIMWSKLKWKRKAWPHTKGSVERRHTHTISLGTVLLQPLQESMEWPFIPIIIFFKCTFTATVNKTTYRCVFIWLQNILYFISIRLHLNVSCCEG